MRPSQVFDMLEDLRNSFSGSLRREGIGLSSNDALTVLEAYQQWFCLLYDLEYLHPDTLQRDAHRLFTDIVKVDVLVVLSAMAECYRLLQTEAYSGFKAHCSRISPHLFSLLRKDYRKMLEGDLYSYKRLMQLFSYLLRLSLVDIDLTQQCVTDYLESEELIPDSFPSPLVSSLNKIIRRWFGPYEPYEIVPAHGPGSVAGIVSPCLLDKYLDLKSDIMLQYSFGADWWCQVPRLSKLDRCSQTIFVPKSYKTFRTISMEPATLQYFQQGVWKVIDKYVRSHRYLKSRLDFHDELRNRRLAMKGSIDGSYATIDLSAASDSVSYSLMKALFRGTWILRYAITTRSTETRLPDGSRIKLKKFAPMGSALCFPIETIVFGAICEHVTRGLGASGDYSVYGDDIIVPSECVDRLLTVLTNLGFRVNHSKSFVKSTSHYRESCGGEYFHGFEVTPIRISRKYNARNYNEHFTALISLANSAYEKSFYSLRHFFLRKMRAAGIRPLFAETCLLSDSSTNYHLRHRWNSDLQREEVRASARISRRKTSPHLTDDQFQRMEEIRYRHWLESTYKRSNLSYGFESYVGKMSEVLTYRWFAAPSRANENVREAEDQLFGVLTPRG